MNEKNNAQLHAINDELLKLCETARSLTSTKLIQLALEIIENIDSEERIATTFVKISELLESQDECNKVPSLIGQILMIYERNSIVTNPIVIDILLKIASAYHDAGFHIEARLIYGHSLMICSRLYGENDLLVAKILNDLALLNLESGIVGDVESLLKRAIGIRKNIQGQYHRDFAVTVCHLADFYRKVGEYKEAEPLYITAKQILSDNNDYYLPKCLNNLGLVYLETGRGGKSITEFLDALKIWTTPIGAEDRDVANAYFNLSSAYRSLERYDLAQDACRCALTIFQSLSSGDSEDLAACLNDLAVLNQKQGNFELAESLYLESVGISRRLLGRSDASTIRKLLNLTNLYLDQRMFVKAGINIVLLLEIFRKEECSNPLLCAEVMLASLESNQSRGLVNESQEEFLLLFASSRPETDSYDEATIRIRIFHQIGRCYLSRKNYADAFIIFERAKNVLTEYALDLSQLDLTAFTIALDQFLCWTDISDAHCWAKEMSHSLRSRLNLVIETSRGNWVPKLHSKFLHFHVKWMQKSIEQDCQLVPGILSLVSGWRMGQEILDEQVRDDRFRPEPVRRFCRLRHELDQLRKQLEAIAKQVTKPLKAVSMSDQIEALATQAVDPIKAEALTARRDELRQAYDQKYPELVNALNEAATYPEYAAIGSSFGNYGEQLRFHLDEGEAIAFLVDFPEQDFRGILLQSSDDAKWYELSNPKEGMDALHYFNENYAMGRGFRGSHPGVDKSKAMPPNFLAEVPVDQHAGAFWLEFGRWIDEQLWSPLRDVLREQNITHLNLITQGRTHSLPWEMNAPAHLALSRFPNGALFAMHKGLVPRPQFSFKNEMHSHASSLGLAASRDSNIPCAAMEIELIKDLWTGTVYSPYDYLSPPAQGVVAGHFSGHGVHKDDTPQQAYLEMGSTPWTVPEMMGSRIHPKRVFISACVAGRTTETGEGDLCGFVTGLMQCGVQELSAATLNMDDMWMLALAVNVQKRLHDDPELTQGEALAQAKVALVQGKLVTQEVKQAWFNALMEMKFATNVVTVLRNVDRGQEHIALQAYASYLEVDTEISKMWLANIVQESGFVARQMMIGKTADAIPWKKVPPQPILGSLLHAVLHFG